MKLFIYEHLMAGAEAGHSSSMLDEGATMLRAAMADFSQVAKPFTIADGRFIGRLDGVDQTRPIDGDPLAFCKSALEESESALIIAPESGGALARLTAMAEFRGVRNLGCSLEAILIAADKQKFAHRMEELGIPHPKTFYATCFFDSSAISLGQWISKPVDGAGCEKVHLHAPGARAAMPQDGSFLAQEFVEGEPMSACVVAGKDGPTVLSINRQFIGASGGALEYTGGEVTDMTPDNELTAITQAIWEGIPGLHGFWGIDYVATNTGPVVIEVNPRLTTSYCALGAALGMNPAVMIMNAAEGRPIADEIRRRRVGFNRKGELEF